MPSIKKEAGLENYLLNAVKALGGVCVKLNPAWNVGIPDRLVMLPGGRTLFIELKRPGAGKISGAQKMWKKRLTELGAEAHIVASKTEIDIVLSGKSLGDSYE